MSATRLIWMILHSPLALVKPTNRDIKMLGTEISLRTILVGTIGLYAVFKVINKILRSISRRRMIKANGCLPPRQHPSGDPILNVALFKETNRALKKKTFLTENRQRFSKYGNTFEVNFLGRRSFNTCEPEIVKTVLATKFDDYSLGPRRKLAFIPVLGHGIFTTDGAAWEHSRAMLRPNFVRNQVADLGTFETHVGHLIDGLPRDGSTVDLQDYFFRLTIDSATEFLFGHSTNCLAPGTETRFADQFATAFNYCTDAMLRFSRLGSLSHFVYEPTYAKMKKIVQEFADFFVTQALEERKHDVEKAPEDTRYVFLRELTKQTQDPVEIRSELLNILLAGRDTTASLLSNFWFELAKSPDVWAKLRQEVDALGGEKPTYQNLKDMKYLKYCLNESLRIHPVVPGNNRTAIRDTVLPIGGGPDGKSPLFVPEGTMVSYSVYSMHRREDFYGPDSEEFHPERWEKLRPGWEYLPFNGGPRICLGQQFALTEASYTTVRLMQTFKSLESRDPAPWCEWLTITCANGRGTKVSLTPF